MNPEQLLPLIPRLRRYARLLTGEQVAGDAAVASMLERLLSKGLDGSDSLPLRTALYRSLIRSMGEGPGGQTVRQQIAGGGLVDQRLSAMPPSARDAFLLVNVEEFSLSDAADVLDLTPSEVAHELEAAGRDIARQIATNVLIIEDEPMIAMTIESIVLEMGHKIFGIAATKSEALTLARRDQPGIILADVLLADGSSGLEAVEAIVSARRTPVIFITAYPDKVLAGCKPEPAILIAKPFAPEHVKAVISQTLFFS
jgi:CheY-like chemotaxis protein